MKNLKISKINDTMKIEFPQGGEFAAFPVNDNLPEPLSIALNPGDYIEIHPHYRDCTKTPSVFWAAVYRKAEGGYYSDFAFWFHIISYIDAGDYTIEGDELREIEEILEGKRKP